METIVDSNTVKTEWIELTRFARFRQNTKRNKQILNLANSSMKDNNILRRQKFYLRSKTTTEKNNWADSIYDEKPVLFL